MFDGENVGFAVSPVHRCRKMYSIKSFWAFDGIQSDRVCNSLFGQSRKKAPLWFERRIWLFMKSFGASIENIKSFETQFDMHLRWKSLNSVKLSLSFSVWIDKLSSFRCDNLKINFVFGLFDTTAEHIVTEHGTIPKYAYPGVDRGPLGKFRQSDMGSTARVLSFYFFHPNAFWIWI